MGPILAPANVHLRLPEMAADHSQNIACSDGIWQILIKARLV